MPVVGAGGALVLCARKLAVVEERALDADGVGVGCLGCRVAFAPVWTAVDMIVCIFYETTLKSTIICGT
tara:strand:+ start:2650 stop:2856 length:207 start_codon:yes stop_codon:yes gene_type:complete